MCRRIAQSHYAGGMRACSPVCMRAAPSVARLTACGAAGAQACRRAALCVTRPQWPGAVASSYVLCALARCGGASAFAGCTEAAPLSLSRSLCGADGECLRARTHTPHSPAEATRAAQQRQLVVSSRPAHAATHLVQRGATAPRHTPQGVGAAGSVVGAATDGQPASCVACAATRRCAPQ